MVVVVVVAIRLNGAVCADINPGTDGGEAGYSVLGNNVGDPNWGALDGGPGDCQGNFSAIPVIPLTTRDYSDAPTSGTSFGDATHEIVNDIQMGLNWLMQIVHHKPLQVPMVMTMMAAMMMTGSRYRHYIREQAKLYLLM